MTYEDAGENELRAAVGALVARHGQRSVAEAVGVAQPTVSRYLLGQRRLSMTLAVGLGRAYPDLRGLLDGVLYGRDAVAASCAAERRYP